MNQKTVELSTAEWWGKKCLIYNKGLFIAWVISYFVFIAIYFYDPMLPDLKIKLGQIGIEGFLFIVGLALANIIFCLGPVAEKIINPKRLMLFRNIFYKPGYCLSLTFPFILQGLFANTDYQYLSHGCM